MNFVTFLKENKLGKKIMLYSGVRSNAKVQKLELWKTYMKELTKNKIELLSKWIP
jgi:hypothetical protein